MKEERGKEQKKKETEKERREVICTMTPYAFMQTSSNSEGNGPGWKTN